MTKATVEKPNLDIIVEQIYEMNKKLDEMNKKLDELADDIVSDGHYFELDKDDENLIIKITYCREGYAICSKAYYFVDPRFINDTYNVLLSVLSLIGALDPSYNEYYETDYESVFNVFNIFDAICRMSKDGWNKVCSGKWLFLDI